jgi:hypothetical protein
MSHTTVLNGFPDLLVRTEFGIVDGETMRLFVGDDWRRTITFGVPGEPTAGLPVLGVARGVRCEERRRGRPHAGGHGPDRSCGETSCTGGSALPGISCYVRVSAFIGATPGSPLLRNLA